jgi:hypothetical protein
VLAIPGTKSNTTLLSDENNKPAHTAEHTQDPTYQMMECPPKDFSKGETEVHRRQTTKGTLQVMSPCGAKVFCTEMVYSESLSIMFHSLSTFIPVIQPRLREIREKKFADKSVCYINPRSKQPGTPSTNGHVHHRHHLGNMIWIKVDLNLTQSWHLSRCSVNIRNKKVMF